MPCNSDAFEYLNFCGTTGTNFNYIKNGRGIRDPFEKKENHSYVPYVVFTLGNTAYATVDSFVNKVYSNNKEYDTSTTYIQSFELTIGTSFEGNINIVTCNYEDVEKIISIVPKENCEFDKFFMGKNGDEKLATAHIDIGWIIRGCNDSLDKYGMELATNDGSNSYKILLGPQQNSGPYIYGLVQSVNVSTDGGVYKVAMKFIDGFQKVEQSRLDWVIFKESQKGPLAELMKRLAKFNCKDRKENGLQEIARIRVTNNGQGNSVINEWKFLPTDGGDNGLFNYFNPNRLSLFEYYRELLNKFRTDLYKGLSFAYDNGSKGKPTILLLEDRQPNFCRGDSGIDFRNIPTYIVGGGDCSPVIKFNTSYQATPLRRNTTENNSQELDIGIGGGNPSATGQQTVQIFDCISAKDPKTGRKTQPTVQENNTSNGTNVMISADSSSMNIRSPGVIAQNNAQATAAHIKAGYDTDNLPIVGVIKAELEIHGDPFWANTINWVKNQYVKIVVINPYCVNIEKGSCENLAESTCNGHLSGIYQVKSCRHTINSGSYTTTLELYSVNINKIGIGR